MSLMKELSDRLGAGWTFRQCRNSDDVDVYYEGQIMCTVSEVPNLELLESCTRFCKPQIGASVRFDLVASVLSQKQLDEKWFDRSMNTYERNAALSIANSDVVVAHIQNALANVSSVDCPTTYDQVLTHVLSKRAAQLLMQRSALTNAELNVISERQKQRNRYPLHDDNYVEHELSRAAACLAADDRYATSGEKGIFPGNWSDGFFTKDHRTNCVKAAAFLIAEIERLDRAAVRGKTE